MPHPAGLRAPLTCRASSAAQKHPVVVTREKGKNGKLMKAIKQRGLESLELPLIEHAAGPDR